MPRYKYPERRLPPHPAYLSLVFAAGHDAGGDAVNGGLTYSSTCRRIADAIEAAKDLGLMAAYRAGWEIGSEGARERQAILDGGCSACSRCSVGPRGPLQLRPRPGAEAAMSSVNPPPHYDDGMFCPTCERRDCICGESEPCWRCEDLPANPWDEQGRCNQCADAMSEDDGLEAQERRERADEVDEKQ